MILLFLFFCLGWVRYARENYKLLYETKMKYFVNLKGEIL